MFGFKSEDGLAVAENEKMFELCRVVQSCAGKMLSQVSGINQPDSGLFGG